jgi:hypothetical protein
VLRLVTLDERRTALTDRCHHTELHLAHDRVPVDALDGGGRYARRDPPGVE